jgi:exopolysaccharide/PEP-CTERM locus tyrosine autokinase
MSSLIEQAAERLEQLRRAGAVVAEPKPAHRLPGGGHSAADANPPPLPVTAAVSPPTPATVSRTVELDFEAIAAQSLLTPNAPRSLLGDQMRVIKRPLIRNAFGKGAAKLVHGNLIMVTSALAGEGKSFTAVNLAMSIAAELDHTVMLVDADVARPSVSRMLGLDVAEGSAFGPGLLDVLDGSAAMSDVLVRTNVDKLTILPSGTQHERATELLASDAMTRLLEEMARRYPDRIIIFDSPPLLQTTESRVLATHMGQIVVVVRAGTTLQADVQSALATIEACPVRMMVLNQATATSDRGYGYGYGYGQGSGSDAGNSILDTLKG